MSLEFRHLRSLLAIHETGHLARAATRLHITQSALSHQIKSMEDFLETPLFQRNCKPLRFTPAGMRLVELGRQLLPALAQAEQDIRAMARGESGRLHIAIECHACFEWLAPVLDRFRKQSPNIEVDIRVHVSFDAITALKKAEVDLVVSSDPQQLADIHFEPLFGYEAKLVMAADHRLTRKKRIAPADLTGETLITYPVPRQRLDVFTRFLQPFGVEPQAVRQTELTSVKLLWVASGRGIAVLPDWVLREARSKSLVQRPLGPRRMKGTMYAAVRRSEASYPYIREFIEIVRGFAQKR